MKIDKNLNPRYLGIVVPVVYWALFFISFLGGCIYIGGKFPSLSRVCIDSNPVIYWPSMIFLFLAGICITIYGFYEYKNFEK